MLSAYSALNVLFSLASCVYKFVHVGPPFILTFEPYNDLQLIVLSFITVAVFIVVYVQLPDHLSSDKPVLCVFGFGDCLVKPPNPTQPPTPRWS